MLVRAVTPPTAYGLVFGFVSTGFNIGASIAPIVYGMLMDHGQPRMVFLLSAAVSIALRFDGDVRIFGPRDALSTCCALQKLRAMRAVACLSRHG